MNFKKFLKIAENNGVFPAEIVYTDAKKFSFSIFKGELINYSISNLASVKARGFYKGKIGFGGGEKVDDSAIDFLINSIKNTASYNESEDEQVIFEGGLKYKNKNIFNKELEKWSNEEKIKLCFEIEKKLLEKDDRISDVEVSYSDRESTYKFFNSYGLNLKSKGNSFVIYASIVVKQGDEIKSHGDLIFSNDKNSINIDEFVDKIAKEGLEKLNEESIEDGLYNVVFNNESVESLIDTFISHASSYAVQKHVSKFEGMLNKQVASKKLTVIEKPLSNNFYHTAFDDEGYPCSNKVVIDKGVLKTYFYNLSTAKKDGVQSTGNAAGSGSKMGISFDNLYIKPGKLSKEELFKKINNGVYVTSIDGLHAGLNNATGDFSLEAEGFIIKDGKKSAPLSLFTVSANMFEMFKNILEIGNDLELLYSGYRVPSIAFKDINISVDQ